MLRLLKFAGVFFGVTLLIFLLIYGINRSVFETVFENREGIAEGSEWVEKTYSLRGLTEYIAEHPDKVSIFSQIDGEPEASLAYREATPRAMGLLSGFFVMAGYAHAFDTGTIDPGQTVSWQEIDRFRIPGVGTYQLQEARRIATEQGLSTDEGDILLEDALRLLARSGSPALHDYLLHHLGRERLARLWGLLGLTETELPVPLSGILLTLAPSLQNIDAGTVLRYWMEEAPGLFATEAWANSHSFAHGDRREQWAGTLESERLGLNFQQQRDLLALFPTTTAREISEQLMKMLRGELISDAVSERVTGWLLYTLDQPTLQRHFTRYGAIYDSRMGLLNGIDFGTSARTGETRVQAVLFDQMQIAVWFHMSSNHMHQDFQQRLIWDADLFRAMRAAIENRSI